MREVDRRSKIDRRKFLKTAAAAPAAALRRPLACPSTAPGPITPKR